MKGFWIYSVGAKGLDKPDAFIILKKGANIITGPSDTGKSHLFSIINYVFGRSSQPDQIPESNGYDSFKLEIQTFEDEKKYILNRKLGKSKISVWQSTSFKEDKKPILINSYSSTSNLSSENNISKFLLELCGLKDSILLKNRTQGKKINLSFKNINQFTSIAEDRIITKASPFYFTSNNSNHILEQSMISLILEGEDFAEAKLIEDPVKKETRLNGKLEFIEQQILRYAADREKVIQITSDKVANLVSLDQIFLNDRLKEKLQILYSYEEDLSNIKTEVNQLTESKIYNTELINRFQILERQYLSDLDRLDFISEAETLSSQLPTSLCPICSNPIDEEHIDHLTEIDNFKEAVLIEKDFINEKISDLRVSINNCESKLKEQNSGLIQTSKQQDELNEKLNKIHPEIEDLKSLIDNVLEFEKLNNKVEFLDSESQKLYEQKDKFEKIKKEKESTDIVNVCDYDVLKTLSEFIEERLKKWNFNPNPKVIFNSDFKVFDITISGKSRGSYGKGRRAISYTACLLGFLDLCQSKNKNFSNFLVLDSPLTTFRDKDQTEETDLSIQGLENLFFQDLANTKSSSQIIIIENKVPESSININKIEFTRDKTVGRYGFYPMSN